MTRSARCLRTNARVCRDAGGGLGGWEVDLRALEGHERPLEVRALVRVHPPPAHDPFSPTHVVRGIHLDHRQLVDFGQVLAHLRWRAQPVSGWVERARSSARRRDARRARRRRTSVRVIRGGCTRNVACGGLNAWLRFFIEVSTMYMFGKNSLTPMPTACAGERALALVDGREERGARELHEQAMHRGV